MAVTDAAAGNRGISAFIVERETEGFRVGKKEEKLGLRASATGEVVFENCRLDNAQLLGTAGAGFIDSMKVLDGGRVSIAALAIGMAQGAYDAALSYSQSRKAIRSVHLRISVDPEKVGGHGRFARRFTVSDLPCRVVTGSGSERHEGVGDGQALRVRGRGPNCE